MSKEKDKSKVQRLSLKGSSKLVAEFFDFSINTILFQRGVYPAEDFTPVKKYGLNMMKSSDDQVLAYIKKITSQLDKWMLGSKISRLVVAITSKESGETVERWQFDVEIYGKNEKKHASKEGRSLDKENATPAASSPAVPEKKSEKEIQQEIQAIFRQVTASVTFLPELDAGDSTFNVLVYADSDSEVPVEWGDSDAKEIENGESVKLRDFSTTNHRVGTLVSYKVTE